MTTVLTDVKMEICLLTMDVMLIVLLRLDGLVREVFQQVQETLA